MSASALPPSLHRQLDSVLLRLSATSSPAGPAVLGVLTLSDAHLRQVQARLTDWLSALLRAGVTVSTLTMPRSRHQVEIEAFALDGAALPKDLWFFDPGHGIHAYVRRELTDLAWTSVLMHDERVRQMFLAFDHRRVEHTAALAYSLTQALSGQLAVPTGHLQRARLMLACMSSPPRRARGMYGSDVVRLAVAIGDPEVQARMRELDSDPP